MKLTDAAPKQESNPNISATAINTQEQEDEKTKRSPFDICPSIKSNLDSLEDLPPINSPHRIERNIQLLNAYCFVMGLSFLSPVYVLYLKENLLGSTTSVSWILATQAITIFVLEVSTRH